MAITREVTFGILTRKNSTTYDYSSSGDFVMNALLTKFDRAAFTNSIVVSPSQPKPTLENLNKDGGMEVLG